WVKMEPSLSFAAPLNELLGHCGPKSWHGDDPLLIDIGRCFDPIAFEGRLTSGSDTGDRRVFDEEILQILFELLLEAAAFQFLKPSSASRREGVPSRVEGLKLLLLFRECTLGAEARTTVGRVTIASPRVIALGGQHSGGERRRVLWLGETFDKRVG